MTARGLLAAFFVGFMSVVVVGCSSSSSSTVDSEDGDVQQAFERFASAVASFDYDRQYDLQIPPSRQSACPRAAFTSALEAATETNQVQLDAIAELYASVKYVQDVRSGVDRAIVTAKNATSDESLSAEFVREDGQWYFNDPQLKFGTLPQCAIDAPSPTGSPSHRPSTASPIPGYTSFHSVRFGYSIQFPSDWEAEPSASFVYQGQALYADFFRGPEDGDFTTNLNINGGQSSTSRDAAYAQAVAEAESSHDDTRVEDVDLFGQPAMRLTYTAGGLTNQAPFDQQQVIIWLDGKEWVLTFSVAHGKLDTYQATFTTIAGTFAPD